jgi:hypothetical protein
MESFRGLLGQLPGNGTLQVKCLYTPTENDANRFPGRFIRGTVTLRLRRDEYQQMLDWLVNDDRHTLSPMKLSWVGGEATLEIDWDKETLKVCSNNRQVLTDAFEYARTEHLHFHSSRRQGHPGEN